MKDKDLSRRTIFLIPELRNKVRRTGQRMLSCLFLIMMTSNLIYADSVTINTYYPAPYGAYDKLLLLPRSQIGGTACDVGTLYVNADDSNLPYYCQNDGLDGEWGLLSEIWTQSGDNVFLRDALSNPNLKVAIGTTTPEFRLTLRQDGSLIAKGTFGSGAVLSTSGSGARLIWYPRKAAFRVGAVTADQWDDANIGNYSTVTGGLNNKASADYTTVSGGENNIATALYATVSGGKDNTANGSHAVVSGGLGNTASGSHAVVSGGKSNTASGNFATISGGESNVAPA